MSAYQSASQRASLQAAAELAIDEGDTPYHNSKLIPRLALGEDVEAILAATGLVQPRDRSALFLQTPPALSSNAISPHSTPGSAAVHEEALLREVPSSSSPLSNGDPSSSFLTSSLNHSHNLNCHGSVSGNLSSSQRHLEKLARPRDPNGVALKPSKPNYGRVLSFAEEEEHDRQRAEQRLQRTKSPCTPRSSLTQRLGDRHQSLSSPASSHTSPITTPSSSAKPRPFSASQQAWLEKLAAPKKYLFLEETTAAGAERQSRPRNNPVAASNGNGSGNIFDRLYASKKQTSLPPEGAEEHSPSSSPPPCPRYGPTHAPVRMQSAQPQEAVFQRLSQPKNKPQTHKDANGLAVYNPYGPVKKMYYGGTTVISTSPTSSVGGPSPTSKVTASAGAGAGGGCGNSRIPKATWDMVDRTALPRAQLNLYATGTCACAECGGTSPQQTVEVVAITATGPSASAVQSLPPGPRAPATRPIAATTVEVDTNAVNAAPNVHVSTPNVVQSAPAKPSGTRPPIVVRTRRYVPPTKEEVTEEEAQQQKASDLSTPAPQPVEATRRRSAYVSVRRDSPAPEGSAPGVASVTVISPPPLVGAVAPVAATTEQQVVMVQRSAPVNASRHHKTLATCTHPAELAAPLAVVHTVKPSSPTIAEPSVPFVAHAPLRPSASSSAARASAELPHDDETVAVAADEAKTSGPAPRAVVEVVPASAPAQAATRRASTTTIINAAGAATHMSWQPSTPTHGVVQTVKHAPRGFSPPAPAAPPTPSTATLKDAVPITSTTATTTAVAGAFFPSSSSSDAAARSPMEVKTGASAVAVAKKKGREGVSNAESNTETVIYAEGNHQHNSTSKEGNSSEKEEPLWRVTSSMTKSNPSSPKAHHGKSVYERLAPPSIPLDKRKTHRQTDRKKCVRPPKPEILKDEEFACQLEDFSPEPRRPVLIKKKSPKATRRKTGAAGKKN